MGIQEEIERAQRSVSTDTIQMSIGEIVSMYQSGELTIQPEFQRLFRWTRTQKSQLVESILVRIPIPPLFIYETSEINWELVDGLQRISTILEFLGALKKPGEEELLPPSALEATKYVPSLANCVWEKSEAIEGIPVNEQVELDRHLKLAIRRSRLSFQILKQPSDPSTKYDLFRRLNRGGTYANEQEVRSCLMVMINPKFFRAVKAAANSESFLALTGLVGRGQTDQTNIEHATRYLVHTNYPYDEKKDVQDFIDATVERMMSEHQPDALMANLQQTFELIRQSAGDDALKPVGGDRPSRYSLRSLEAIAVGVGKNLAAIQALPDPEAYVRNRINDFWSQPEVDAMSASGLRGTQRLTRTIPFGTRWFDPNAQ